MNPYIFITDTQDGTGCAHNQLMGFEELLKKKEVNVWFLGFLYRGREGLLTCLIRTTVSPNSQSVFPFPAHPAGE